MDNNNDDNNVPLPPMFDRNESGASAASAASNMSFGVTSVFGNPLEKTLRNIAAKAGVAFGTVLAIPKTVFETTTDDDEPWDMESDFYKDHAKMSMADHKRYVDNSEEAIEESNAIDESVDNERARIFENCQEIDKDKQKAIRHLNDLHDKLKRECDKLNKNYDDGVAAKKKTENIRIKTAMSKKIWNKTQKYMANATCERARKWAGLDTPADWDEHENTIAVKLGLLVKHAFLESPHCPVKSKWVVWSMEGEKTSAYKTRAKKYVDYADRPPPLALESGRTVVEDSVPTAASTPTACTPTAVPDLSNAGVMAAYYFARSVDTTLSPRERKQAKRRADNFYLEMAEEMEQAESPTPKRRKTDNEAPMNMDQDDNETNPMHQVD